MYFYQVANVFDQVESISSRLEITQRLAEIFAHASPQEAEIVANISLGLLHAPYRGTQFNLSTTSVIPIVADMLGLSVQQVKTYAQSTGDIGSVLAAHAAWQTTMALSVQDVYAQLQQIEQESGTGSQERKAALLKRLLLNLDHVSAKFIVRIIIGKLRLGFSDMTLIDAFSWMAVGDKSLRETIEDAYNMCADIGLIIKLLKSEGIEAIRAMQVHVGIPIRPAGAERLPSAEAIIKKLGHCVAQPKLDGFRLQIHIDKRDADSDGIIHFFSRNLQDMSRMFPDLVTIIKKLPVTSMVAEGEAIAYDANTGTFLPFQETVKRKRKHDIAQVALDFPLKLFFFDLLYVDGVSWLNKSHDERRKKLADIVSNTSTTDLIQLIEQKEITNVASLKHYFMQSVQEGLEGLVVKRSDAIYQPGKRNFNWIKLKRLEEGMLEDTIDCVILGYYYGQGKRSVFGIGAFLVGVYNPTQDLFQTIAKVGTGLSDTEWQSLRAQCDEYRIAHQPVHVICAKELVPDVWVAPEIIVTVQADEITQSPMHTAGQTDVTLGYALRFPRFVGYRPDKSAYDSTTSQEIQRLYQDQIS